jgi:3,4-dihydroxy 2-butanone 4-phosphate synthase/GTP cyclohydrolase II
MAHIAEAGRGVVIYLRQEGRGIGLEHKLQAYNLQDEGYDTVEANIMLGHQADEREYWAAAAILNDLDIRSVQLLTNNPAKIEHLRELGITVDKRLPVIVEVNDDNRAYLETKAQRMRHMLSLAGGLIAKDAPADASSHETLPHLAPRTAAIQLDALKTRMAAFGPERPFVTLTYAQSLNGAIGGPGGTPAQISGPDSMRLTHQLRAAHDAILIGVGTLLADDPMLRLRLAEGMAPKPIVLDSRLRTPVTARILANTEGVLIATLAENEGTEAAAALEAAGASLIYFPAGPGGKVSLTALLSALHKRGLRSVMVEGGAQVIASFLQERLVDALVVTVAPQLLAGVIALPDSPAAGMAAPLPKLTDTAWTAVGDDLILWGTPAWET